jgi:hypothetical protein
MTASWQDRLRHALQAHALVEAGDQAQGTTDSTAALQTTRDVQAAITRAEADGATEEQLDRVITAHTSPR